MDYDATTIAATYDAARGYRPEVLQQWLAIIAAHAPAGSGLIVDVGCGTGRFSRPLSERLQAKVIGIDPSERMLAVARGKPDGGRVEFRQGSAEKLPLGDACADMVFISMVLHHLRDRPAAARECRRVLRSGGRLCMRTGTRDHNYPQSRFFPAMLPMLENDLPSAVEIIALFEGASLRRRAHEIVTQVVAANWQEFADKLALRADSFLARLPDSAFEAGMEALRAHAARSPPEEITERIDFFVFER
jgi:ubiquinone/menaquinone biosynthesis C-methylase UbiE